jgi:hypothetical protein
MTFSTGTQNEHVRDLAVHEAIGPAIPPVQAACIISMGVIALLMAGVMPAIFGALADAGRLTEANIGLCATSEGLMMGISAALSGIFLQTERLPLKGICAAVAFAVINIVSIPLENLPLVAVRALAGIPEGIMIWITVGMIARSEVPERWAGVFFTALVSGQLALAFLFAVYVIPHFGAAGGFVTLAIVAAIGAGIASRLPQRYAHLQPGQSIEGVPPPLGCAALAATLVYTAPAAAVAVYMQPLAHQAGLSADVARTTLWLSLAAQVAGGSIATALAGRIHYMAIFTFSAISLILVWATMEFHPPAWLFIAANMWGGLVTVLYGPFLVPLTIEADPSRRAAMQSASTQVLAGALGPLGASIIVSDRNVHGSLWLGGVLIVVGLMMFVGVYLASSRNRNQTSAIS